MSENKAAKELIKICGTAQVLENEPMSRHTSFRIGGPADIFIMPDSAGAVSASISFITNFSESVYPSGSGAHTNMVPSVSGQFHPMERSPCVSVRLLRSYSRHCSLAGSSGPVKAAMAPY